MVINAVIPFVLEAVPERTFPHWWVLRLNVTSTSPEEGTLYMELLPYNKETGDRCFTHPRIIQLPLWQVVANVPEALDAMHGVFGAVPAIVAYDDMLKFPPPVENEPGGEEVSA